MDWGEEDKVGARDEDDDKLLFLSTGQFFCLSRGQIWMSEGARIIITSNNKFWMCKRIKGWWWGMIIRLTGQQQLIWAQRDDNEKCSVDVIRNII